MKLVIPVRDEGRDLQSPLELCASLHLRGPILALRPAQA